MVHPDNEIQLALVRLNDALCSWERSTGRESVLILREVGGFVHRSVSGKPVSNGLDDVVDAQLVSNIVSD